MINWNNYFEHIFVISRCINFDRHKHIDEQFSKIGIINYKYWYVPDYDLENSKIFKYDQYKLIEHQRCTLGHYTLWKTCEELKYNNILIVEDDVEFIDDINIIEKMLELYIHSNSDIYMFDYNILGNLIIDNINFVNAYLLASCYSVNIRGLQYLIKQHEKYNLLSDNYFFEFNDNIESVSINYKLNEDINIDMNMLEEDTNMKLTVSPTRICTQLDKNYNDINLK